MPTPPQVLDRMRCIGVPANVMAKVKEALHFVLDLSIWIATHQSITHQHHSARKRCQNTALAPIFA